MKITKLLFTTGILLGIPILPSCLDDDDNNVNRYFPNALVTVKEAADETCFPAGRKYHPATGKYHITPRAQKRSGPGQLR